ncbi:MAG: CdaR family protein [Eubacteriales bacterium]
MNKTENYKIPYMVLSVFLAFILWLYVIDVEDPDQTFFVRDIPVIITGENILESQGLTITTISQETVDLTLRSPNSVSGSINNDNLSVTIDVSKLAEAGEYLVNYTLNKPTYINANNIVEESRTPQQLTITVGELATEVFPIDLIMRGSVASGYQLAEHTVSPETVVISGSIESVSHVHRVAVILEQEDLSERFSGELPLVMLDINGNKIEDFSLEISEKTVFITVPVVVVKEIPLTVNFIAGGGAIPEDISKLTLEPNSITVSGSKEDMAGLEEISLGSIDLSKVIDRKSFTLPISIDHTLNNVSGTTEAVVTVQIEGLDSQSFEVTNIQLINIPHGYTATASTQMRTVVVRGSTQALAEIDPSQLRIVADLANISAIGSTSVSVKVYLDASEDVGVTGEYNIVVDIGR